MTRSNEIAVRLILLALASLPFLVVPAHGQDFVWARQLGGTGFDRGTGVAVDGRGNVYATGNIRDTATLLFDDCATARVLLKWQW